MLNSLHIQNFKAWKDTGRVRLAPLTVIFGANSAGKSSLGHLLLALKQTAQSSDRRRALHLGDGHSLIELGTFEDCVHGHDLTQQLIFALNWRLPHALAVRDPMAPEKHYAGQHLWLAVTLSASKLAQPEVRLIKYRLGDDRDPATALEVNVRRGVLGSNFSLDSEGYQFLKNEVHKWPADEPEKFYRVSEVTLARYKNAGFLTDFALATEQMLNHFYYLGPMRESPRRSYQWAGDEPEEVGQRGEYAIAAILAAQGQGRRLNRGPKKHQQPFAEFIASWMQDLGVIHSFSVKPVVEGRKDYEVLVRTHAGAPEVKITDVGFGVSQVLPALVEAFYCPPNSTVWMEQPEIHLHPQVQGELADVFISAIQARENGVPRNVQLIVESHSEHFLTRLQRRVAEGKVRPDEVAIYFCQRAGGKSDGRAELEPLRLNQDGEIENWPDNFFGDEMADVAARMRAAMERRRQPQQPSDAVATPQS
jgi:predicted ATPase